MASPTSIPIARLRAAGCKVSTVIGHDPAIGDFIYSVRVPDSFGDLREAFTTKIRLGFASVAIPRVSDGHHVIVAAYAYRRGIHTAQTVIDQYRNDTARALNALADQIEARS